MKGSKTVTIYVFTFITLSHRMRYGYLNPPVTNALYVVRCFRLLRRKLIWIYRIIAPLVNTV